MEEARFVHRNFARKTLGKRLESQEDTRVTNYLYSNLSSEIISYSEFCSKYLHIGVIYHCHHIKWKLAASFTLSEMNK